MRNVETEVQCAKFNRILFTRIMSSVKQNEYEKQLVSRLLKTFVNACAKLINAESSDVIDVEKQRFGNIEKRQVRGGKRRSIFSEALDDSMEGNQDGEKSNVKRQVRGGKRSLNHQYTVDDEEEIAKKPIRRLLKSEMSNN